jgi:type IV secretory pathway VirB10-like protein
VFSAYLSLLAGRAAILREGFLSRFLRIGLRMLFIAALATLLALVCLAQSQAPNQTDGKTPTESKTPSQDQPQAPPQTETPAKPQTQPKTPAQPQPQVAPQTPITLDTSETLFSVLTAMNSCGYDVDLNISDAQRLNVRAEVQRNLRNSEEAQGSLNSLCEWYVAHKGRDTQHDLSQFVSLALYLQGPPHFLPRV